MIFSKLQGNQLKLRLFILETPPKIHQKDELYVYNINSQILAPKISSSKKNHFPIPENKLSAEKFRFLHQKNRPSLPTGTRQFFWSNFLNRNATFFSITGHHTEEKNTKKPSAESPTAFPRTRIPIFSCVESITSFYNSLSTSFPHHFLRRIIRQKGFSRLHFGSHSAKIHFELIHNSTSFSTISTVDCV